MASHWFAFPWWLIMLNTCSCAYWLFILAIFPWKLCIQILCTFVNWLIFPFIIELWIFFAYSKSSTLSDIWFAKYLPFNALSLHFLYHVHWWTKFSVFLKPYLIFIFCSLCFWTVSRNPLPNPRSLRLTLVFFQDCYNFSSYILAINPFGLIFNIVWVRSSLILCM